MTPSEAAAGTRNTRRVGRLIDDVRRLVVNRDGGQAKTIRAEIDS